MFGSINKRKIIRHNFFYIKGNQATLEFSGTSKDPRFPTVPVGNLGISEPS